MKPSPKIVGLVQVRDEWPLLAVSVSHALLNHVDEVFLLNHSSAGGFGRAIGRLQTAFKDRLHVLSYYDPTFWQEASTNALIEICRVSSPDWIYVFDADEFLLTHAQRPLKALLSEVGPEYEAVRYQVQNWVSTEDFDAADPKHYRTLRYRAVPNFFAPMPVELLSDEIQSGNLNFFDVPFGPKLIFRNSPASWLGAGSHMLKSPADARILDMDAAELRAAHFPLLSRIALDQRRRQGELLIKAGFPPYHGWQSQMIHRLSLEGDLDPFWESHSISDRSYDGNRTLPSFIEDAGFPKAIEPTLSFLEKESLFETYGRNDEQEPSIEQQSDTQVPFRTLVHLARKYQLIADDARRQSEAALQDRAAAVAQLDAMKKSLSWSLTRPLRSIKKALRQLRRNR